MPESPAPYAAGDGAPLISTEAMRAALREPLRSRLSDAAVRELADCLGDELRERVRGFVRSALVDALAETLPPDDFERMIPVLAHLIAPSSDA